MRTTCDIIKVKGFFLFSFSLLLSNLCNRACFPVFISQWVGIYLIARYLFLLHHPLISPPFPAQEYNQVPGSVTSTSWMSCDSVLLWLFLLLSSQWCQHFSWPQVTTIGNPYRLKPMCLVVPIAIHHHSTPKKFFLACHSGQATHCTKPYDNFWKIWKYASFPRHFATERAGKETGWAFVGLESGAIAHGQGFAWFKFPACTKGGST
jgi:hypothetical protein